MMIRIKHWAARAQHQAFGLRDFERLDVTRGALTVVSDDGEDCNLRFAELLGRSGVAGCFAVADDFIGRPGFLSYSHLRELQQAGHEIAFHGRKSVAFDIFHDAEVLRSDIEAGLNRLRSEGLVVSNLVYRWGTSTRSARRLLAPLCSSACVPWSGLNERVTNRYALRRIAFGAYTGRSSHTQEWFFNVVESAAKGQAWPILMLHPGAAGHTAEHDAMLRKILQHARHAGLPVRTLSDQLAALGVGAPTAIATAQPIGSSDPRKASRA